MNLDGILDDDFDDGEKKFRRHSTTTQLIDRFYPF
jgi:hypothetical protein